jgi:phosphatidate phosphatase PAH1
MYDLPDGTSLTQKVVVSLVLAITKVLTIEDHKLHCTFHHVTFGSQSLLEPSSDQTGSDTN